MFDKSFFTAFASTVGKFDFEALLKAIPESERASILNDEMERRHIRIMSVIAISGVVIMSAVAAVTRRPELVTAFAPKA